MKIFPKTETANIVQQMVDKELLLYNLTTNKAFCLNPISADIYNLCDGTNEISSIAEKTQLPEEIVQIAISDLSQQDLLTEQIGFQMSRREVVRKIGLSSLVALPLITTLVAPTAAHAASASCPGTGSGGTVIGEFPSNTNNGTTVCAGPARRVCQSCDYDRGSSTCTNANCTTVICICS